mgnify:CR=1 FL=1
MIEKGRTDQIIEQLIDSVENGQNVPFAPGKVSVNKEETIRLLRELENIVQGELKIYREVNDRKGKILTEAKKEAEEILTQAEQNASGCPHFLHFIRAIWSRRIGKRYGLPETSMRHL